MSQERFRQELPIVASLKSGENPCFKCGKCCFSNIFPAMFNTQLEIFKSNAPIFLELLPQNPETHDQRNQRLDNLTEIHYEGLKGYHPEGQVSATEIYPGFSTVSVVGRCPNLSDNNRCNIYDERPEACIQYPVGGEDCNYRRMKNGLPKIDESGQVIIPDSLGKRFFKIIQSLFSK